MKIIDKIAQIEEQGSRLPISDEYLTESTVVGGTLL